MVRSEGMITDYVRGTQPIKQIRHVHPSEQDHAYSQTSSVNLFTLAYFNSIFFKILHHCSAKNLNFHDS